MTKVFAIVVDKGGCGKTTTAVALATGLHQAGKKTLLIDLDPQGDAGRHLGYKPKEFTKTVNTLFTEMGVDPFDVIIQTDFGLSFIPANKTLDATDRSMTASQVGLLKPFIELLSKEFEFIIIDTRRAGSLLTISALVAATDALIPLEAEFLAAENLEETMQDINNVKKGLNKNLQVFGILPTKVRKKTRLTREVLNDLNQVEEYKGHILDILIRDTIKFGESSYAGQPIQLYDADAAAEYQQLVEHVING
jgi:chromosome partitioning protein